MSPYVLLLLFIVIWSSSDMNAETTNENIITDTLSAIVIATNVVLPYSTLVGNDPELCCMRLPHNITFLTFEGKW